MTVRQLLLLALTIVSASALADDEPLNVLSYEDTSCGAWVKSANVEWARAQYLSWFRGFVSGYNFGNPTNQVQLERMPEQETLFLFIDKYCREHPLNPFVSAAFELVRELRDSKTEKP